MAALHWSADQFWCASMFDIVAALDAQREINDPTLSKQREFEKFKTEIVGKNG